VRGSTHPSRQPPCRSVRAAESAAWLSLSISAGLQQAVRELLACINQAQDKRAPLIVCGDFNADPDSDEIRMLTGRTNAPAPGLSFKRTSATDREEMPGLNWPMEKIANPADHHLPQDSPRTPQMPWSASEWKLPCQAWHR
jgi:endonuclease/exonuclease/phosphatase family metal-dependent hydrolase